MCPLSYMSYIVGKTQSGTLIHQGYTAKVQLNKFRTWNSPDAYYYKFRVEQRIQNLQTPRYTNEMYNFTPPCDIAKGALFFI